MYPFIDYNIKENARIINRKLTIQRFALIYHFLFVENHQISITDIC